MTLGDHMNYICWLSHNVTIINNHMHNVHNLFANLVVRFVFFALSVSYNCVFDVVGVTPMCFDLSSYDLSMLQ
jgi:hypothetical protein